MIYIIILIFLLFGCFHYDVLKSKFGKEAYTVFVLILLGLMSAFRYRVGGDSIIYEESFEYMPKLNEVFWYIQNKNLRGYQPLWLVATGLIKSLGGDAYDFQLFHALICNSCLYIFLKRYTKYALSFLVLFGVSFLYFYYSFEIQRETLAVSVFLLNIKNLEEKKYKTYYLLAIVSFLFHISAIVLFLLPIFQRLKIKNSTVWFFVIIGLPLSLLKDVFLNIFSNFLFLDSMKTRAEIYSQGGFSTIGLLAFYTVRVIVPLPFILSLNKIQENSRRNTGIVLGYIIFSIFAQIIVSFERFLNYFYIWLIVEFLNMMYLNQINFSSVIRKNLTKISFFGMLYFIILYKVFIPDSDGRYGYKSLFIPYEDKFDKRTNAQREEYLHVIWGW